MNFASVFAIVVGLSCSTATLTFAQEVAKASLNSVWADSAATRRALADTSAISPLCPGCVSKQEEKQSAIQSYCACELAEWADFRNTFEGLISQWTKLRCRPNIKEFKNIDIGKNRLNCDSIESVEHFQFKPFVLPLVSREVVKQFGKEYGSGRLLEYHLCQYQVGLMFPAYEAKDPVATFAAVKASREEVIGFKRSLAKEKLTPWFRERVAAGEIQMPQPDANELAAQKQIEEERKQNDVKKQVAHRALSEELCNCERAHHEAIMASLRFLKTPEGIASLRNSQDAVDLYFGASSPHKLRNPADQVTMRLDETSMPESVTGRNSGTGPNKVRAACEKFAKNKPAYAVLRFSTNSSFDELNALTRLNAQISDRFYNTEVLPLVQRQIKAGRLKTTSNARK